jgi:hypothetical protein
MHNTGPKPKPNGIPQKQTHIDKHTNCSTTAGPNIRRTLAPNCCRNIHKPKNQTTLGSGTEQDLIHIKIYPCATITGTTPLPITMLQRQMRALQSSHVPQAALTPTHTAPSGKENTTALHQPTHAANPSNVSCRVGSRNMHENTTTIPYHSYIGVPVHHKPP